MQLLDKNQIFTAYIKNIKILVFDMAEDNVSEVEFKVNVQRSYTQTIFFVLNASFPLESTCPIIIKHLSSTEIPGATFSDYQMQNL